VDRAGVISGLNGINDASAAAMASLVKGAASS